MLRSQVYFSHRMPYKCLIVAAVFTCLLHFLPGACSAQQSAAGDRGIDVVIFDNSREQFWLPFDVGFFGYSELAVALREAGYLVTESNVPVTLSLPKIKPSGSVLVMGPASGQWYSRKEINAIVEYVKKGGGLLILGEQDAGGRDNFQNPLASQFGMLFRNSSVIDKTNSISETAGQWLFARSDFFDIERVILPVTMPLMMTQSAFPILSAAETSIPSRAIVGAAASFGEGRVVCIGDSQFLINGGKKEIGIECAQNREFAMAVFNWLAGREDRVRARIVPEYTTITGRSFKLKLRVEGTTDLTARVEGGAIEPRSVEDASGELTFDVAIERDGFAEFVGSDGSRKRVVLLLPPQGGIGARLVFDTRGYAPEMNDPINGMLDFAALLRDKGYWVWAVEEGLISVSGLHGIIVVNPLRTDRLIYAGDLKNPGLRWVLLGEPFTTIGVRNSLGEWFRDRKFSDREIPIGTLAEEFGITFLPYVVFEPDTSRVLGKHPTYPILDFGVETCNAFTCGIVDAEGGTPVLLGSSSAWGLKGGLGLRAGARSIKPGKDDYRKSPVVAVLSENVFAVADLHVFSAQHIKNRGNWSLVLALADWLAGVEFRIPKP